MASYSQEPGYAFANTGKTLDPLKDRLAPDAVGNNFSFGLGTDSSVMDFLDEVFQGGYGGTIPPGQFYDGGRMNEINPQDFISQQLAGDVIPMPAQPDYIKGRMTEPGVYQGTRGAAAINQFGGRQSPYLDLLNVLQFPGGGSMAPPIGRR